MAPQKAGRGFGVKLTPPQEETPDLLHITQYNRSTLGEIAVNPTNLSQVCQNLPHHFGAHDLLTAE